jgi:hypothetical protein
LQLIERRKAWCPPDKKVGDVDSYGAKCLNGQKGDVKGTRGRSSKLIVIPLHFHTIEILGQEV